MNKKILLGIISLAAILIISGCGSNNKAENRGFNKKDAQRQNVAGNDLFKNQPKAALTDLSIGKKIMATGVANSDNSVNASRIIIGDIGNFGPGNNMRPPSTTVSGKNNRQNLGRARGAGGMTRVNGEIIKKDDVSLVMKLADGGSKIVYFSDKTEVYIFIPPTTTLPINSATTSTASST